MGKEKAKAHPLLETKSKVTQRERRRFFRSPAKIPIRLQFRDDPLVVKTETGDLSEGGLHFFWMRELAKGTVLSLRLPLLNHSFKVRGEVIYSLKDRVTGLFRTGISFPKPSSAFRVKLARQILRIQKFREGLLRRAGSDLSEEEAAQKWIERYSKKF